MNTKSRVLLINFVLLKQVISKSLRILLLLAPPLDKSIKVLAMLSFFYLFQSWYLLEILLKHYLRNTLFVSAKDGYCPLPPIKFFLIEILGRAGSISQFVPSKLTPMSAPRNTEWHHVFDMEYGVRWLSAGCLIGFSQRYGVLIYAEWFCVKW